MTGVEGTGAGRAVARPAPVSPSLLQVPEYVPGRAGPRSVEELAEWCLLESNEMPWPPVRAVGEALAAWGTAWNRYPDPEATSLRTCLAEVLDVEIDQVAVGGGSMEILRQAVAATVRSGEQFVVAEPTFPEYSRLVQLGGGQVCRVPLDEELRIDLHGFAALAQRGARGLYLCNPNNPTSTAHVVGAVEELMCQVPTSCLVVVDEAYGEFAAPPYRGAHGLVGRFPNLLVLRTFSKAYGLAGLRVGYGIGAPELIEALRKVRITFSTSAPALVAAEAALRSRDEIEERCALVVAERNRLAGALQALGVQVASSQANFVWMDLGSSFDAVMRSWGALGVRVRPFPPGAVRVTVGRPEENAAVVDGVAQVLGPAPR